MSSPRILYFSVFLNFAIALFFLSACVSVDTLLAPSAARKADDIKYTVPASFKEIRNNRVDHAWLDPANGNTIAFLSECSLKTDAPLTALQDENLEAMSNLEILKSETRSYNDREALMSTVNGQVDGVGIRLRLIIFKKNGCNYTLSFVARQKYFNIGVPYFESFAKDFVAP